MLPNITPRSRLKSGYNHLKKVSLLFASILLLLPVTSFAQIGDYEKYADISGSDLFNFDVLEDLKYGVAKTNYRRLNQSGTYDLITQKNLELDLFLPQTPDSVGKRAVIIMIPAGGRSGCRGGGVKYLEDGSVDLANGCNQETNLRGDRVDQEGINFNHLNNSNARQYAQRGLVVASIVTRYTYEHSDLNDDGSNRWFRSADGTADGTNPKRLLTAGSAHLEFLAVDLKRAVRWLTANADQYNIDPNYIFIEGGSGAAKMASIATVTNENQLIVDDPANIDVAFERAHNNWDIRNSTPSIKGAILRKGDLNGNYHLDLMDTMSEHTDSFMFWTGTADKSIVHGMSEVIEDKCEILQTCSTQLYSLANKTHSSASSARFLHTKSGDKTAATHVYDFIVNAIERDKNNLPVISISQNISSFPESVGTAQVEITRSGDTSSEVVFTVSADQMREVTTENAKNGSFDLITKYVAKSSNSDGLVMYNDSTGYAYEDAFGGNLRIKADRVLRHAKGKGAGEFTEISSGDDEYHDIDFVGRTQVLTLNPGQSSAVFNINITDDDLLEENECFKVRLLNAYGARIGNSVETFSIQDDDSLNPSSHAVCGNPVYDSGSGDTPTVLTLAPANRNVEEGASGTLTIAANKNVSENISVEYQTRAGTASAQDFVVETGTAVIPSGQNSINIEFQTKQDTLVESNERFTVELNSVTSGDAQLGAADTTVVTILDDDESSSSISLSRTGKTVQEGGGFVLSIEADQNVSEDVSVEYTTQVGTASEEDFVQQTSTVVIPAGQNSIDIAIQTTQDTLVEPNERFTVELNEVVAGNAEVGAVDTTVVTIIDNDSEAPSNITLSRATKSIQEGGSFVLSIEADQTVSEDVSIEYQTQTGTASAQDFVQQIGTAIIPAGQNSVDIAVQTTQDTLVEPNERFTLELIGITAGNAQLGSLNTTAVTIIDNDEEPSVITLSRTTQSVSEGGGFTLSIESNQNVSENVSIRYRTKTGTASASDFTVVTTTAVIPVGQNSVNVAVQTTQDTLVEADEGFTVELIEVVAGNAELGNVDTTNVTIIDNDEQPSVVTLSRTTKSVTEGGGFTLSITSNKNVSENVSVRYRTKAGTASASDFTVVTRSAVIPAGQNSVDISVQTTQDTLVEADEGFTVELIEVVVGNAGIGNVDTTNVTIVDDDEAPSIIVLSRATKSVLEGDGFVLTLESNQAVTEPVSIEYQTKRGGASFEDYVEVRRVAIIPAGQNTVDISIQTKQDDLVEANEKFDVVLNSIVAGNAVLGNLNLTEVTIVDDEEEVPPLITLSRESKSASEGTGFTLTLESSKPVTENISIEYQTKVGTASAQDFVRETKTAVIPTGQNQVNISIQTREDEFVEANEKFSVQLNAVTSGNAQLGAVDTTIITIVDDDEAVVPTISMSRATKNIQEGKSFVLPIEISETVNEDIVVEYQTRVGDASTSDFGWVKSNAVIFAGQSSTSIKIDTYEDAIVENNEAFTVTLNSVVEGNTQIGDEKITTVVIVDNDSGSGDDCSFFTIPRKGGNPIFICL